MREKYNRKIDKKAFLYPDVYIKLIDLATEKQNFTFRGLTETGARINEFRHININDTDKERETLLLRMTKVRAKLGEKIPDPRKIAISSKFFKYFRKNVKLYKVMSTNQTGKLLKKYLWEIKETYKINQLNPDDYSAHNLRKTFGTWMLSLGVDGFKLAQHLGHSPEMLRIKYASPDIFIDKDREIMREVLGNLPSRLRNF